MDTTKKGNKLEHLIFELFDGEISRDTFFAKKEHCRLLKKQGYYSKDREKDIIFDLSIEIFLPGQETYSILVLIECKNYNHPVPVDDIEEFYAKTQQVSGANVKAIVVATNAFQEGAFKVAKSKGIGLLRYFNKSKLDWVLTRSPSSLVSSQYAVRERPQAFKGLHAESFESSYFDCYCYIGDNYTNSLNMFFSALVKYNGENAFIESLTAIENISLNTDCVVRYTEVYEIEALINHTLNEVGYKTGKVPLEKLCHNLKKDMGLEVIYGKPTKPGALGAIKFNPLEIHIDNEIDNITRERFTLAHELGHLLLNHSEYMLEERCYLHSLNLAEAYQIGVKDIMRMEWQANQFASSLLLPRSEFIQSFLIEAAKNGITNRGFGILYVDEQKCNLDNYYNITSKLMNIFNVSRSVVKIRLIKLGFLNITNLNNRI